MYVLLFHRLQKLILFYLLLILFYDMSVSGQVYMGILYELCEHKGQKRVSDTLKM